ncbi:MAG: hypothetical protein BMS9Abin33_0520 [Gammaproteobacteria bacterium]|nr:MAG: hypothetical protein BMS9Abin33_0520 [Gammaproteobacteria bacterium]
MKKINLSALAGIFGLFLVTCSQVFALGLGGTVQLGGGSGEQTLDNGSVSYDEDIDFGTFNIGFTLDTALTDENFFNYRLGVGLETLVIESEFGVDTDLSGIFVSNDFGFSVYSNSKTRVWLGPQVKVGLYTGDNDFNEDIAIVTFGVGPVVGANFKTGSNLVLAVKAGLIFHSYAGEAENSGGWLYDIDGDATVFIVNFSLFYDM